MGYLQKVWRGEERLWVTFWLICVLGSSSFLIVSDLLNLLVWGFDQTEGQALVTVILVRLSFIWFVFSLVAVWRSANAYTGATWKKMMAMVAVILGGLMVCSEVAQMLGIIA